MIKNGCIYDCVYHRNNLTANYGQWLLTTVNKVECDQLFLMPTLLPEPRLIAGDPCISRGQGRLDFLDGWVHTVYSPFLFDHLGDPEHLCETSDDMICQ